MSDILEKATSPEVMNLAWRRHRNDKADWAPDLPKSEMATNVVYHLLRLAEELRSGAYRPHPVRFFTVNKGDGKKRVISAVTLRDKVAQRALLTVLSPLGEKYFHHCSYAYRPGRNIDMAVAKAREYVFCGMPWLVDADIKKYFDNISHPLLLKKLRDWIGDKKTVCAGAPMARCGNTSQGLFCRPPGAFPGRGGLALALQRVPDRFRPAGGGRQSSHGPVRRRLSRVRPLPRRRPQGPGIHQKKPGEARAGGPPGQDPRGGCPVPGWCFWAERCQGRPGTRSYRALPAVARLDSFPGGSVERANPLSSEKRKGGTMAKARPVVVAYDISKDSSRRRVYKILRDWRIEGQKSVHECRLTMDQAQELFIQLGRYIDPATDMLMMAWLEPRRGMLFRGTAPTRSSGRTGISDRRGGCDHAKKGMVPGGVRHRGPFAPAAGPLPDEEGGAAGAEVRISGEGNGTGGGGVFRPPGKNHGPKARRSACVPGGKASEVWTSGPNPWPWRRRSIWAAGRKGHAKASAKQSPGGSSVCSEKKGAVDERSRMPNDFPWTTPTVGFTRSHAPAWNA